jgi:hypothetical protein
MRFAARADIRNGEVDDGARPDTALCGSGCRRFRFRCDVKLNLIEVCT